MLPTPGGASRDENGSVDDDPTCMQTVVPVSLHTVNIGSQWPLWTLGRSRRVGSSEKHTARTPRSALRTISCAASSGSQSGMMHSGMLMPIEGSHHSSTIQSLYAFTHASASSGSSASLNVWPQNRGNVGNGSDPSTQLISKSFLRSLASQHPGRMSSYVTAVIVMTVLSNV